jgi:hypothetical protein
MVEGDHGRLHLELDGISRAKQIMLAVYLAELLGPPGE